MAEELILIMMDQNMKVNGKMINRKGMGKSFGLMQVYMKDISKMEKKTEWVK